MTVDEITIIKRLMRNIEAFNATQQRIAEATKTLNAAQSTVDALTSRLGVIDSQLDADLALLKGA